MDYLVCPDDGAQLKAVGRALPETPIVVNCPTCGQRFTFGRGGLTPAPAKPDEQPN